jgi:hypothetical protein
VFGSRRSSHFGVIRMVRRGQVSHFLEVRDMLRLSDVGPSCISHYSPAGASRRA